jgi:anti-sigma regulatory factor (Ser/Thr protein kinase)
MSGQLRMTDLGGHSLPGRGIPRRQDGNGRAAPGTDGWPLRSRLELAAFPSAVPCARLHARLVAWEWGLGGIAETVELVVSELSTNAVKVSGGPGGSVLEHDSWLAPRCIVLVLASDGGQVLVQVWDGNPAPPVQASADEHAESGRGLLLVEALCEDWGWYLPEGGNTGKWVWGAVASAGGAPSSSAAGTVP